MDAINVTAVNKCSYPVRIAVGHEEDTKRGIYTVLRPLETRAITIDKLAYEHLVINPKVTLIASNPTEEF